VPFFGLSGKRLHGLRKIIIEKEQKIEDFFVPLQPVFQSITKKL
jgi:hypothetical protein